MRKLVQQGERAGIEGDRDVLRAACRLRQGAGTERERLGDDQRPHARIREAHGALERRQGSRRHIQGCRAPSAIIGEGANPQVHRPPCQRNSPADCHEVRGPRGHQQCRPVSRIADGSAVEDDLRGLRRGRQGRPENARGVCGRQVHADARGGSVSPQGDHQRRGAHPNLRIRGIGEAIRQREGDRLPVAKARPQRDGRDGTRGLSRDGDAEGPRAVACRDRARAGLKRQRHAAEAAEPAG